jgi:hypothetical protein
MEIEESPEKSVQSWIGPVALLPPANAEKLTIWEQAAVHAYPPNTLRAWRADWALYKEWAEREGKSALPASPAYLALYIRDAADKKKASTVRRYLATIARAHLAAGYTSPCASEPVRLAIKAMTRLKSVRQRQAKGLNWEHIKKFIETAGEGIRADRERALLCGL